MRKKYSSNMTVAESDLVRTDVLLLAKWYLISTEKHKIR